MFQPISLICSFLRKTSISDLEKEEEIQSEDQLPAISFDINLSTLSFNLSQST